MKKYILLVREPTSEERRHCVEQGYATVLSTADIGLKNAVLTGVPVETIVDYAQAVSWVPATEERERERPCSDFVQPKGRGGFVDSVVARFSWLLYGWAREHRIDGLGYFEATQAFRRGFNDTFIELFLPTTQMYLSDCCLESLGEMLHGTTKGSRLPALDVEGFGSHMLRCHWDASVDGANYIRTARAYVGWMIHQKHIPPSHITEAGVQKLLDYFVRDLTLRIRFRAFASVRKSLIPAAR
jgi:hypothetical protein